MIFCFIKFGYRQCTIDLNWELQMKSERNPIKAWYSYTTTSFSQYAKENVFSLKSMPLLHDMNVAEYSEYGI